MEHRDLDDAEGELLREELRSLVLGAQQRRFRQLVLRQQPDRRRLVLSERDVPKSVADARTAGGQAGDLAGAQPWRRRDGRGAQRRLRRLLDRRRLGRLVRMHHLQRAEPEATRRRRPGRPLLGRRDMVDEAGRVLEGARWWR
eukprot:2139298-Prymnesium_polylepis.1